MTVLYADTSAVFRAYFRAEDGHDELRKLLIGGVDPVATSELTRVEFASAAAAARRAGKLREFGTLVDRFETDCGADGAITLLQLDNAVVLPMARRLVIEHAVRALDAIHLAVALTDPILLASGEVVLVTRDRAQAAAAKDLGLAVL